jgi:HYR domain
MTRSSMIVTALRVSLVLMAALALALSAAIAFAPSAGAGNGTRTATATSLRVALAWRGGDAACPTGYPATTECHPHPGGPTAVPGLGFVSQSLLFAVDIAPSGCPAGTQRALSYPAQLVVEDRGTILLSVAASDTCAEMGVPVLSVAQTFTITGGTGVFAGASGSGIVSRSRVRCCPGFGTDNWDGTITAPGLVVDLTPPTIQGAHNRVVRAPRTARRIRVRYKVTALDAIDGALRPTCRPRSGSRFRVGRRATVRCSVSDHSANVSRAKFMITVRRR